MLKKHSQFDRTLTVVTVQSVLKINAVSYVQIVVNGHVSVWEVLMILRHSESTQMRAAKFILRIIFLDTQTVLPC